MPETITAADAPGAPTPPVEITDGIPVKQEKARSLWSDAWHDLRRNPIFVISSVLILVILLVAVAPGLFTSVSPRDGDLVHHFLSDPKLTHFFKADWFGYDNQGRSIYSRTVYGARASVVVGVLVTLFSTVVGGLVGMLAGYFGGWIDAVLSRLVDVFFGIPFLLGSMVVLNAFTTRSPLIVSLSLAFLGWTQTARVMRGSVISIKQADYVHAAQALGASTRGSCSGTSCRTPSPR